MGLSFVIVALLLTVLKAGVHAQVHNQAPCPPGKVHCDCGQWPQGVIQCNRNHQNASASLMINYCLTYNNVSQQFVLGRCPFNLLRKDLKHYFLPLPDNAEHLNSAMCGQEFNRAGDLCGECKPNHCHPVYFFEQGFRCINRTTTAYNWAIYLAVEFVPVTIFFIFILVFHIRITSAAVNGFVFFSQLYGVPVGIHLAKNMMASQMGINSTVEGSQVFYTLYSIWNLNFFRHLIPPFCLQEGMNSAQLMALEYVTAIFPLLTVALVYTCIELHARNYRLVVLLLKPLHCFVGHFRRTWDLKASAIGAFASFVVLSYTKFTFATYHLLLMWSFARTWNVNGTVQAQDPNLYYSLYFDATVNIFIQSSNLGYAVLAMFAFVIFVCTPPVFLLLYPTKPFLKCLNCCRLRGPVVQAFVDAFQGDFKDGTNSTRDYRYFAGLYFLLRLGTRLVEFAQISAYLFICIVVYTVTALVFAIVKPYKNNVYNIVDSVLFGVMALVYITVLYGYLFLIVGAGNATWILVVLDVLTSLPLLYITGLVLHLTFTRTIFIRKCWRLTAQKAKDVYTVICRKNDVYDHSVPDRLENPTEYQHLL